MKNIFKKIKIRKFSLADLRRILKIEKSSFTVDAYPMSRFKNLFKKHPEGFWVAQIAGKVVGYVIAYITKGMTDFVSIAVDPKYRRFGIGKKLVNFIIKKLKRQGAKKASLEVRTTNKASFSFFRNLGFRITKTLKGFYRDRGDAYQMRKKI